MRRRKWITKRATIVSIHTSWSHSSSIAHSHWHRIRFSLIILLFSLDGATLKIFILVNLLVFHYISFIRRVTFQQQKTLTFYKIHSFKGISNEFSLFFCLVYYNETFMNSANWFIIIIINDIIVLANKVHRPIKRKLLVKISVENFNLKSTFKYLGAHQHRNIYLYTCSVSDNPQTLNDSKGPHFPMNDHPSENIT